LREGNEPITSLLVVGDCPRTTMKRSGIVVAWRQRADHKLACSWRLPTN